MENTGFRVLTERCGNLRWKGMFIDVSGGPEHPEITDGDRIYWCVYTQNCLGPDGQVADAEACSSLRSCYQGT
jgi:hypothetical protein